MTITESTGTTIDLSGRTAIVTGASRGIGLAIAQHLAAAGANVVLTSRKQESADAAAALVGGPGTAVGMAAHAAHEDAARACVDATMQRFGRVDILVNNAGTNPAYGPLIDQQHTPFAKTFDLNLWAPILWSGLVVRAWMGEHGGSIINTASIGGMGQEPGLGVYNASKCALIHVTRQLAMELAPKVRVNCIAPGVVRTRLAEALWKNHERAVVHATALGRIGEPADLGPAVVFLASDASSWVTGTTLTVDGGQILGDASAFRGAGGAFQAGAR